MAMATTVKERPIIFSGPMVRKIRAGKKTMTRRVVKPQPRPGHEIVNEFGRWVARYMTPLGPMIWVADGDFKCPYGSRGDLLWVRETWAEGFDGPLYRADFDVSDGFGSCIVQMATGEMKPLVWKPSIHMKRCDSRLTLRINEVRVERLQDISARDAVKEGCECNHWNDDRWLDPGVENDRKQVIGDFQRLWDSINGKRLGCAWADSPWVWVLGFERIDQTAKGVI